jgi:hypothetical protein
MAGFIRRFGFFPGKEVITQIEGVVTVDTPPPESVAGVSTGVVCMAGEFPDMTFATHADGTGSITALYQPQEIFSSADFLQKFGGFDSTIGDFGGSEGNGFVSIRSKKYSRLVLVPINLASAKGGRFWRSLPVCTGQANALPVVPVSGAVVSAGTEFQNTTAGRLRVAKRIIFTALAPIVTGTGGAIVHSGADAVIQPFTVAGFNFATVVRPDGNVGVKKGDIVVIGNNNAGALQPLPGDVHHFGAGTYRVAVDAASGSPTIIQLELLNGSNYDFADAATVPFRVHVSSDADSAPVIVVGATVPGGYAALEAGGDAVPVHPLTDTNGANNDGNWAANTQLTPNVVPPAITGASAGPLSGLAGATHAVAAVAFTKVIQQPNTPASASVDALYQAAIDSTLADAPPTREINFIWASRTSSTIRNKLKQNALDASVALHGRKALDRPDLSVQSTTAAIAPTDPGVGANRDERVYYAWPGHVISVPEAVNIRLKTSDGLSTIDGLLDIGSDSLLASILSNLPPERNPGQAEAPVPDLMAPVVGFARGTPGLVLNDYIALRSNGVVALRLDRVDGFIFQSGITSSLDPARKNINRRDFADFCEDSIAQFLDHFAKLPLTQSNKDNMEGGVNDFLADLRSENDSSRQRIDGFLVDALSGNTPESLAANIFVLIWKVRMTPTADFIVSQAEVGNSVVVTRRS